MSPLQFPYVNRRRHSWLARPTLARALEGALRRARFDFALIARTSGWLLRCALFALLACGPPTWKGGIHAFLAWSPEGVRVLEVPPESPAERAGLRANDRIVAIDGKPIAGRDSESVQALLSGDVGSVAQLQVLRDGQPVAIAIEREPYVRKGAER